MGKQSPSPVEKGEFFIDTSLLELSHSDLKAYRPRTPADQLKEKMERLRESKVGVGEFLEALPIPAVILEGNRQIVASNRALADLLSQLNIPLNLGLRPGETLRCLYSQECSTGCGTGEKCRLCPAFKAILSAQAGQPSFNRCDLTIKTRQGSKQINVMVSTAPLPSLQPAEYILMTFQDITPQVRRHNLDRIFFHDLLNTNWLISGYVNLMMLNPHKSEPLYVERLHQASQRLVDEIEAQRDLANVQAHELPFNFQSSDLGQLIEEVLNKYHNDPNNTKLNILTRANLPRVTIFTLPQLLRRLLRGLFKSISYLCTSQTILEISYLREGERAVIVIHERHLYLSPKDCANFQQLLALRNNSQLEAYAFDILLGPCLQGRFKVSSSPGTGTNFIISLPLVPTPPPTPSLPYELQVEVAPLPLEEK